MSRRRQLKSMRADADSIIRRLQDEYGLLSELAESLADPDPGGTIALRNELSAHFETTVRQFDSFCSNYAVGELRDAEEILEAGINERLIRPQIVALSTMGEAMMLLRAAQSLSDGLFLRSYIETCSTIYDTYQQGLATARRSSPDTLLDISKVYGASEKEPNGLQARFEALSLQFNELKQRLTEHGEAKRMDP